MVISKKKLLPQEGSGCSAAGESLTDAPASVFPSYSGGGKDHHATSTAESDHSDTSMITAGSRESPTPLSCSKTRPYRERSRSSSNERLSGDEVRTVKKLVTPKRGRGRPPTTGQYIGLKKAKEDYLRLQRRELEIEAERELQTRIRERLAKRAQRISCEVDAILDLKKRAEEQLDLVCSIATRSKNLKGTFQKALKDAAASIRACMEGLSERNSTEEMRHLQEANVRLQSQVSELKEEVAQLRTARELAAKSHGEGNGHGLKNHDIDVEQLSHSIMVQVGTLVNARFEALEEKLVSGKRIGLPLSFETPLEPPGSPAPEQSPMLTTSGNSNADNGKDKGKANGNSKKNPKQPQTRSDRVLDAPKGVNEGWVKVKKRKRRTQKSAETRDRRDDKVKKKKPTQLRPPRSAAIVITLQPEAEERGESYASILRKAKEMDLTGLGPTAIRVRKTATGARLLEISGAASSEKADEMAKRLGSTLKKDDVRVSRVRKCAEVRISELDDSVTKEEVVSAISRVGGCPENQITSGEIRKDFRGLYTIWIRCPIVAAKEIVSSGRILIGWLSARVKLLATRSRRCWRCLEEGHLRENCTAPIDRSGLCFRCSRSGHKANNCFAAPHCILCASSNRPANHTVGSKPCFGKNLKNVGSIRRVTSAQYQRPTSPTARSGKEMVPTISDNG